MKKINVVCVIGTRPEALKMLPIIEALNAHTHFLVKNIITGQHKELLVQMLQNVNMDIAANFDVMATNQSLNKLTSRLFKKFDDYLAKNSVDLIIAQGDTTTTLVAALSAFYNKIPFAHIEAGLRTSSIHQPFPEEFNRRTVSQISTFHFCPTKRSEKNLEMEKITKNVFVTGNTIIDTLYKQTKTAKTIIGNKKKMILITCHRRENFGAPLLNICNALRTLAQRNPTIELLFLVHPNPNVSSVVSDQLGSIPNITLSKPLDYEALISAMQNSYLILTDSGGLQEEAPALGKPVLVLRNETERPEGITCGASILVGNKVDTIIKQTEKLLNDESSYTRMSQAGSPYGDGQAAKRIVKIINHFLVNKSSIIKLNTSLNVSDKFDFPSI